MHGQPIHSLTEPRQAFQKGGRNVIFFNPQTLSGTYLIGDLVDIYLNAHPQTSYFDKTML